MTIANAHLIGNYQQTTKKAEYKICSKSENFPHGETSFQLAPGQVSVAALGLVENIWCEPNEFCLVPAEWSV